MKKLRYLARFKNSALIAWGLLQDKRMPRINKILFLGMAVLYVLLPTDFVADFIPFLGWADDVAVLAFLLQGFIWSAPAELKQKPEPPR